MMLDAIESSARKARGQQLALRFSESWADDIVREFMAWSSAEKASGIMETTIERFRVEAKNRPAKHYAWGALPRLLCKARLIAPKVREDGSQVTRRAASPKTHAHDIKVWRLL